MTTVQQSSDSGISGEVGNQGGKWVVLGSCWLCWGFIGLVVVAGLVLNLLGLI